MNVKRVLVTGADGFVGRALVQELFRQGIDVVALGKGEGDIADCKFMRVFGCKRVDHVFHLAAKTFIPDAWKNPFEFERTNVCGTINVLEFCRRCSVPLTIVSAYVYGIPEVMPIPEHAQALPNNPYALTKLQAEQWCYFYANSFEVPVTVLRPFNIFGRGQKEDFLIPSILRQVREGKEIVIQDDVPKRDYCYLDDVVRALLLTLRRSWSFEVINIGSGVSLTVRDVVNTIQSVAGTELRVIVKRHRRKNEIQDVCADISKAESLLDWKPNWTFREGIEDLWRARKDESS